MPSSAKVLDAKIDQARNEIRADRLDITYGELAAMYDDGDLNIAPDYQRLFRWDLGQKTKFIESILLGIPIPAIFVAENETGRWELVDGLQRISTVLEFMGHLKDAEGKPIAPSRLAIPNNRVMLVELDGFTFEELSLRSRLSIKRASCRVEVLKVGSKAHMKYEVFERLHTGGAELSAQEIRNCIFRATDPDFMDWVNGLSLHQAFAETLELSDMQKKTMFDRGLVLRYFTMKNAYERFEYDVEPFITEYIRDIIGKPKDFDRNVEAALFKRTFDLISNALREDAWRHCRDGRHRGPVSVYIFDVLSVAVARNIDHVERLDPEEFKERCLAIKTHPQFVANTGGGANIKSRAIARLAIALEIMKAPPKKSPMKQAPNGVRAARVRQGKKG